MIALEPKHHRLPRSLQLQEIMGEESLYSLKKKKQKNPGTLFVCGQTIENSETQKRINLKQQKQQTQKLVIKTIDRERKPRNLSQFVNKICTIQFSIDDPLVCLRQSVNKSPISSVCNHRLRLKTLENRVQNKYYTVQLSTKSHDNRSHLQELNITNYRNINLQETMWL